MDILFGKANITEYGLKQKITGSSANVDYFKSKFGAIDDDGTVFIVGEPLAGPNGSAGLRGTVSIYTGNYISGWALKQTITGGTQQNYFGTSVAINHNGSMIAVAQPSTNVNSNRGRISIYTGNAIHGWNQQDAITSRNSGPYSYDSVMAFSRSGNVICMGHPNGDVWAYRPITGNPSQYWDAGVLLPAPFQVKADSVSTNSDGSTIIVGRGDDNDNGISAGAVHIFTGNSYRSWTGPDPSSSPWKLKQKITGIAGSKFGFSTSISDNNIIMAGAPSDSERGTDAGAVLFYTGSPEAGWGLRFKHMAFGAAGANYGLAVNINASGNFFGYSSFRDQASMWLGDPRKDLYNAGFNRPIIIPLIHAPERFSCSISTAQDVSTILVVGSRGYYNTNYDYDHIRTAYLCTVNLPNLDQIIFKKSNISKIDFINT